MDSRYQPEGLSFDNKNDYNSSSPSNYSQYPPQGNQQQSQYYPQPGQQQNYSSPPIQQQPTFGLPAGPRLSGPLAQGQVGLPPNPRMSNGPTSSPRPYTPQNAQQANNFSRLSGPQQQQSSPQNHSNVISGPQEALYPGSGDTSRSNTWVQTPPGPYPTGQAYFNGPIDANGYPLDIKGKQAEVENPFKDPPARPPPFETPPSSTDLEKQKHDHDDDHGHGGWDYHSKIPHKKDPNQPYLPMGERLRHFTWAWYTTTMATGGIATLISVQPHPFPGLLTIGAVFFIFNLILFFGITGTMILRFTKFPGAFKASITHEREGLFLGPFFLSVATIITGTQKYIIQAYEADHPNRSWAVTSIAVAFWTYTFFAFCLATFQYSFLFCSHTYKLTSFMPSWLLPVFPIMLSGTIASVIAADQPVSSRMPIIAAGLGCQGLGFTIAILMYAHYIGRLMQVGYPGREHRGAMFIGVGPPSFTILALIGMANALPDDFDLQGDGLIDAAMLRTLALVIALFLWVLAMWFFMITLVAVIHQWALYFHLGWWAMVFPNTGFVIATISIGNSLKDETILFVGNGLTIAILCMWVYVLFNHIQAVYVGDIMYPMMDEDNADH
ncbi:voltage-dependent anion channel-domain-containing protein [Paraphoma chrysanthemicola]|uniref:Voltage-dependent anion channel-domain-containing protein n=1 Tax=Paraphoma chrysanthemicola TaxID=798071 RepID=A0A8K0VYH0_9PLEO|nr:voltage-dependent anion channel-domain-containing protein [Paraphoma chrysanthemicola]